MIQYIRGLLVAIVKIGVVGLILYLAVGLLITWLLLQSGYLNLEASASTRVAVKELEEYLNQFPPPTKTTMINTVSSVYCCGNGNHDSADIIVSHLYNSDLNQSEILAHYESYNKTVVFVDESLFQSPLRPCASYNIVERHNLQPHVMGDQTLYLLIAWDDHSYPGHSYCH